MSTFYNVIFRVYFVLKNSGVISTLQHVPGTKRVLSMLKQLIGRRRRWMRVQSGLSQGMWMKLSLTLEGSYLLGTHEPEVQRAISAVVRPGNVIYDVGAHVGTMALGAARLVGDLGQVVAFDGDPENVKRLLENSSRNGLEKRLVVVHAAVWSSASSDGICFRRGITARSQGGVEADGNRPVLGSGEVINVPAITLDDFVTAGGPLPQLLKIDVEGGEYHVLRGGAKLFSSQRPIIIAEVHRQKENEQITAWLREHQYCAKWNQAEDDFPRRLFAWPREIDGSSLLHSMF